MVAIGDKEEVQKVRRRPRRAVARLPAHYRRMKEEVQATLTGKYRCLDCGKLAPREATSGALEGWVFSLKFDDDREVLVFCTLVCAERFLTREVAFMSQIVEAYKQELANVRKEMATPTAAPPKP